MPRRPFIVYAPNAEVFFQWAFESRAEIEFDNAADEASCVIGGVEYRAKLEAA